MKKLKLILCMICILLVGGTAMKHIFHRTFTAGDPPLTNPYKGFVCWGENLNDDPRIAFAYVPVYWGDLEPVEGEYDFESIEEQYHFEQWKQRGVSLILRVIMDEPSKEKHMDIPEWLYERSGGTYYSNAYGKGLSPDYRNRELMQAHHKLIAALYDRYGNNSQLAFIQLGSLGHWGEWHTSISTPFPAQSITDRYVQDYLDYFPSEKLLLRRPYAIGNRNHMGLYNDSFGNETHETWLSWISDGYISDQNQEALQGMPDFWKYAPSGGEFATDHPMEWYFTEDQFQATLSLLKQSHTSFLGPNMPVHLQNSNVDALLSQMGYCYTLQSSTIIKSLFSSSASITLKMENTGIAPMYARTDLILVCKDADGNIILTEKTTSNMTQYLPGPFTLHLTLHDLPSNTASIWFGIANPLSGNAAVTFANEEIMTDHLIRIG